MTNIIVNVYSCNKLTYKNIYKDAVIRAYKKKGIIVREDDIHMRVIDLSDGGTKEIQQQRAPAGPHSRSMEVYENGILKFLIGVTNTNYDEDIRQERLITGRRNKYGSDDYHANTYLIQGINKIFSRYFELCEDSDEVQLYFYLLDTNRSYPSNKFNLCSYRMLTTLGFDVLNLDEISFDEFRSFGFRPTSDFSNLSYPSFNKLMNDKLAISKFNSGNIPAYLKCEEVVLEDGTIVTEKYIYTFKALGAQAYDCFLTMWTLHTLAIREKKKLEFLFSSESYGHRIPNRVVKFTKDLPKPVKKLLSIVGINVHYETSDEILQAINNYLSQYNRAKANNDLRNQTLFRNNMREKGMPTKCAICGCEVEDLLEAAHIWGVAQIKQEDGRTINRLITNTALQDLIDESMPYHNEQFYKKYTLVNSGDNGIWLCRNHHGLFDNNYFCFDSEYGKVIFKFARKEDIEHILGVSDVTDIQLGENILNERTKIFLQKRVEEFLNT